MRAGPKPAVNGSPAATAWLQTPRVGGGTVRRRLRPGAAWPWRAQAVAVAALAAVPDRLHLGSAARTAPRGLDATERAGKDVDHQGAGLYELLAGAEGAGVVVVTTDERQAGLCHRQAARMVELHPELGGPGPGVRGRPHGAGPRIVLPGPARGAQTAGGPGLHPRHRRRSRPRRPGRVRGRLPGHRQAESRRWCLAIGTPGPELENTVLGRLRTYALDHPEDPLVVWREHSAAGFEDHPVDCAHCWQLASPALDDFLARDGLVACLPPKMRKHRFGGPGCASSPTSSRRHGCPLGVGSLRGRHPEHPGRGRGRLELRRLLQRRHHGPGGRHRGGAAPP